MKTFGKHLLIEADARGILVLKMDTDNLSVKTSFTGLNVERKDDDDDDDDDDDGDDGDGGENGGGSGGGWRGGGRRRRRGASQKVHVKLDVKGFEQALSCSALAPESLVCCLYRVTKGESYLRGPTFSSSSMLIQLGRVSVPVTRNTLNQTWLPRLGQSCHHQL